MTSPSPQPRTTWVDLTDIVQWQGPPTGIQRVVFEFGRRVLTTASSSRCCVYDTRLNAYIEINDAALRPNGPDASPTTERIDPGNVARPSRIRAGLKRRGPGLTTPAVAFDPGDRLVIIGANWLTSGYAANLEHVTRVHDLEVSQVIYDLIPSLYPQWAATGAAPIVTPFLRAVLPLCAHIVCISHNTQVDLERFIATNALELRHDARISVVTLGADTSKVAPSPPHGIDRSAPFLLCVGTLEVRKNQFVLYQAYREAQARDITLPNLYFVGRSGWLAEATEHAIRHDPQINAKLRILESISDAELEWLYQHCRLTLYPSLYEGWGLPIAESLSHGKVCITTRQASLPEVGGDLADYISPFDSAAWLHAIIKYDDDRNRAAREATICEHYTQRTWNDAATDFCTALGITAQ